jgi:hypothetical protein
MTPIESLSVQQANVKYNSDATDELDFEITTKDSAFVLEAANHVDLRQWIRAINGARSKSTIDVECISKSGLLHYQTKTERRARLYWFVMTEDLLQYYDANTREAVCLQIKCHTHFLFC